MTEQAGVAIAQIPAGQPIDLFSAIGFLLDAALGGAFLAPGNDGDVAAVVRARDGQTAREAAARLRAAAELLGSRPVPVVEVVDDEPDGPEVTLNRMRQDEDGAVSFGLGGSEEAARDLALHLLSVFVPAMRDLDAPNYLEFPIVDSTTGQAYALLVVKPDGVTPHEARHRAEAEVERLRARLAELEASSG